MTDLKSKRSGTARVGGVLRVCGNLLVLLVQWGWGCGARGQEAGVPAAAVEARQRAGGGVLAGRVLVADRPADSGTVVLHRVSGDSSGEVDSAGVEPGGFFELMLPAASEEGDVFFATIRYQDILYFGRATTGLRDVDDTYVVQAYPSLPAGPEIEPRVRARSVFAARPDSGRGWVVADFFELHNGAPATLVSSGSGPTWSHALPRGAVDARVGRSDLSPGMASFRDGRVNVSAPVAPGESVYLFRYVIPEDDYAVPVEAATGSMELFVREPAGDLEVTGLVAAEGVELEGVRYRRFAGRDMAPSVVAVAVGGKRLPFGSVSIVAVLLTLALAGAGALLAAGSRTAAGSPEGIRARRVLVEIARLDEDLAAGRLSAKEHSGRRARLLEELGS